MSAQPSPGTEPAHFTRFPEEVRAAYRHFLATRDEQALQVVIHAVLKDLTPKKPGAPVYPELRDDLRIIEDLGFDSLAVAEMVFIVEDAFKVAVTNAEIGSIRTVGELRRFVLEKLGAKQTSG